MLLFFLLSKECWVWSDHIKHTYTTVATPIAVAKIVTSHTLAKARLTVIWQQTSSVQFCGGTKHTPRICLLSFSSIFYHVTFVNVLWMFLNRLNYLVLLKLLFRSISSRGQSCPRRFAVFSVSGRQKTGQTTPLKVASTINAETSGKDFTELTTAR